MKHQHVRQRYVESLALSIITYCLPVYGATNTTLMKRVQKLQDFAAKICAGGARWHDHATPSITQMNWLKIDRKVVFDVAVAVYKIQHNMYPECLFQFPTITEVTHSTHTTRQHNNLHVPHTNTPCPWFQNMDTLPQHTTDVNSLYVFRKRLKEHLSS